MQIFSFRIDSSLQEQRPYLRVESPCPCGCSGMIISISDGEVGVAVYLETEEERADLRERIAELDVSNT